MKPGKKPSGPVPDEPRRLFLLDRHGTQHKLGHKDRQTPRAARLTSKLSIASANWSPWKPTRAPDDYLVSALDEPIPEAHLKTTRKSGAVPGVFEVMARGFARGIRGQKVSGTPRRYMVEHLVIARRRVGTTRRARQHAGTLILAAVSMGERKEFYHRMTSPAGRGVDLPQPVLRGTRSQYARRTDRPPHRGKPGEQDAVAGVG